MDNQIAIIGISGRFPGAKDIGSFWENLCQKKESIANFNDEELLQSGVSPNQFKSSSYVRARGVLDHVEDFDSDFFSIPFAEAQLMDPQHRHFLECSWEAMEDAGYNSERFHGKIGVFGSASRSTYFLNQLYFNQNIRESAPEFLLRTGNENDCLTTRVSYKLNLKGPSLSIQTACSSALVSVCVACNHLLDQQCDMAIAGGVSIFSPQQSGYLYQKEMIFSPDGHCRPFDANAKGTVPGNGVGIIVLKRLTDAIADKDQIYAVIRGYAINNDGRDKLGFSAPSIQGQAEAITTAIRMANIDPMTIRYVEAHGTGTAIGDPIEIKALLAAFAGSKTDKKTKCCIGSVKSNIGHLMEASGIAGLIKAVLVLKNKKIPPTLHFTSPNPHVDFTDGTFYINSELEEWNEDPWPRRAGVSAFGFGGTNAHIILEEGPKSFLHDSPNSLHILPISARTPQALEIAIIQLGEFLQKNTNLSLADIAYSLQMGRKEWKYRKAFVCGDIQQAISLLIYRNNKEKTQLEHLAKSWESGDSIDWETLHRSAQPSRISLPSYPFERKRCWIDPIKKQTEERAHSINSRPLTDSIEEIEKKLITIWKTVLGCDQIERKNNFFDLGGESLLALQILDQIERAFDVSLSLQSLYQAPTVMQLAQTISLRISLHSLNVVRLRDGNTSSPLFMIHPIQGTVFCYEHLIRKMNLKRSIFGIQANELGDNLLTIEEIANSYIQEIKKFQKSGPYLLFGASFGGLVAYEIALQLKKNGDPVSFLGMLDVINPSADFLKKETLRDMQTSLLQLFEGKKISAATLNELSDKELSDQIAIAMGLNLLTNVQQEKIMNLIDKHLYAILKYAPKSYDGEIVFFEMNNGFFHPLWVTWKDFAKQGIKNIILEGNHQNMLQKPDNLAKHLEQWL